MKMRLGTVVSDNVTVCALDLVCFASLNCRSLFLCPVVFYLTLDCRVIKAAFCYQHLSSLFFYALSPPLDLYNTRTAVYTYRPVISAPLGWDFRGACVVIKYRINTFFKKDHTENIGLSLSFMRTGHKFLFIPSGSVQCARLVSDICLKIWNFSGS